MIWPYDPSAVFLILKLYMSYIYLFGPAEAYLVSMSIKLKPLVFFW